MIEQTYFLDMIPGESTPPVVHVSQFDVNSRTLTFNLMKGGVAFVPDAGMSVTLDGMKPDNHVFSYPMTVNGSSVSIDVLTQMTVVSGHVRCEVSVSNQTGKIGSANFILAVEESPIDSGSISESDIPIFEDLKNQAQQAAADAEQSASDAEGFATDAETAATSVSAMMATVESTSIASKAYSVGDYLVLNGKLYEVTRAIVSGGRLTVGTNISETTVGGELTSLNNSLNTKVSSVNEVLPDTNGNVTLNAEDIPADGVGAKDVSGNPIIVTDAVAENAQNLSVDLEPIQDLHGYDHPWAGGAGKNLANLSEVTGGTVTGESVTVQGGTASYQAAYILMNLKGGTTYTFSARATRVDDIARISFRNVNNNQNVAVSEMVTSAGNLSVSYTPSIDEDKRLSLFCTYGTANPSVATVYEDIQLEVGSEPTAYKPYSNICPITGRTSVDVTMAGKNLCSNASDIHLLMATSGVLNTNSRCDMYYFPTSLGTVTISADDMTLISDDTIRTGYVDEIPTNGTVGVRASNMRDTPRTYELDTNYKYFVVMLLWKDVTAKSNVQVEIGSSATPYEEYAGQSVTVNLGQTVYGGTLDVTTGLLTVDRKGVDMSTLSWGYDSNNKQFWSSLITDCKTVSGWMLDIMASNYEIKNSTYEYYSNPHIRGINGQRLYIVDESFSGDVSALTQSLAGQTLVYPLETSLTIQLTPAQLALLEGYNILTTDGDTLNLRYTGTVASNVQLEIDEFEESTRKLAGSLAMVEISPATANHTVGSYLMLNNRLCKVTAAIATGEQIIVGSNVSYTTVAEELTAILAQINA